MDEDGVQRRKGCEDLPLLHHGFWTFQDYNLYVLCFCGYILNGFFTFHPFFPTGIVNYDIAALLALK